MRNSRPPHAGLSERALQLHALGLRLVPLIGKRAILKNWPELHLGADEILAWSEKGVNWGIITGDPLIVIDTDSDEAEAYLREKRIDSTVIVRSGGGGFHYYFRTMEDMDIRSKSCVHGVRGLDLRAWRSYIVAAGSVHPDTGDHYAYLPGKELHDIAALPVFQPHWVADTRMPAPTLPSYQRQLRTPGRIYDIFAYLLRVESVQGQSGSNGCYRACCLLRDDGYSPLEAWPILLWWNARKPVPPWSKRELIHKLESVYRLPLTSILDP